MNKKFKKVGLTGEKLWDLNNGITLCEDCHKKEHNGVVSYDS
jgi:5-methylcytosine-specific restriction endonuclease McrA